MTTAMRRQLLLLMIFLNLSGFVSFAEKIAIHGNSIEYKGVELTFYHYANQISDKEVLLASTKVDEKGDFELSFDVNQTEYIFCHTGVFFLYLFTEPGRQYTIKLPSRIEKKQEDILNPFFQELKVQLVITSFQSFGISTQELPDQEVNYLIQSFDNFFDPFYAKYASNIYVKNDVREMDTAMHKIEATFGGIKNPYFQSYYTYRVGLLKFMSTRFKSRNISDNYFLNKPVLYDNPAFMELFNQVYEKYFVYFGRTKEGKVIYDDINTHKSLTRLKQTLAQNQVLANDTLKEFVILKGVHDGCYEMQFSREALLSVLDSLGMTTKIEKHRIIAKDIRDKVTRLLPGFAPPSFKMLNQDSTWVSLSDFKGSYVYVMFCTTQNYACLKEYEMIKKLYEKHGKLLKIITISFDEKLADTKLFARKMNYNWTFLHFGNQPAILKDYDIRTFPTYFLIDRDGKLALSPAPSPAENFEVYFFQQLRAKGIL
jgi:peroxiredoxin